MMKTYQVDNLIKIKTVLRSLRLSRWLCVF